MTTGNYKMECLCFIVYLTICEILREAIKFCIKKEHNMIYTSNNYWDFHHSSFCSIFLFLLSQMIHASKSIWKTLKNTIILIIFPLQQITQQNHKMYYVNTNTTNYKHRTHNNFSKIIIPILYFSKYFFTGYPPLVYLGKLYA